ncbi:MAG: type II secretion system F family protein [Chloroflexota bacterium]
MTTTAFDAQIPLLIRHLEVALRSGYNVKQSFEMIAQDMDAPASSEAQWVVDQWNAGTEGLQIFDKWLAHTPSRDLDLVIAAIRVQFEIEGNLADILQLLAQIMEKRTLAASA